MECFGVARSRLDSSDPAMGDERGQDDVVENRQAKEVVESRTTSSVPSTSGSWAGVTHAPPY